MALGTAAPPEKGGAQRTIAPYVGVVKGLGTRFCGEILHERPFSGGPAAALLQSPSDPTPMTRVNRFRHLVAAPLAAALAGLLLLALARNDGGGGGAGAPPPPPP